MQLLSIKETCLYVSDIQRSYDFYYSRLGLPLISMVPARHVFFRVGSGVLLCFNPEITRGEKVLPPHYAYGPQHIAFEVDPATYDEWKNNITSMGIAIAHEHEWKTGLKSFYFNDPDENVLEIVPTGMWD